MAINTHQRRQNNMAVIINGDTGIDKITDGSVVQADLASGITVASLSTASGSAPSYSARAWVNFNGTGTVAIRASGNVSSITDNGTGIYTVNFITAMNDVNYSSCVSSENSVVAGDAADTTTSYFKLAIRAISTGAVADNDHISVQIFSS